MIARNYIKYPEALRFQVEMFSNGYHNSPRIMRLVEVVFNWTPSIPAWWQALKNAENLLIKGWRKMQYELFGKKGEIVTKTDLKTTIETPMERQPMNVRIAARKEREAAIKAAKPDREKFTEWMRTNLGNADCWRSPSLSDELDAPVYMSFCKNMHSVNYLYGNQSPYWGGFSA